MRAEQARQLHLREWGPEDSVPSLGSVFGDSCGSARGQLARTSAIHPHPSLTTLRAHVVSPTVKRQVSVPHHAITVSLRVFVSALVILGLPTLAFAEPSPLMPEVGHNYGEHETPRMTALGGPTRAGSNSLTALYSNPANMAAAQLYHVGAFGQIYPEARRQSYGGAIVDSLISSSGLAGGLGGVWTLQDPDGIRREWMDLRFGLAMPIGDVFFMGLTAKYITLQQNGNGPLGASEASGGLAGTNIIQTLTFDAGVTLRPIKEFSIAVTGHNLTNAETTLLPLMGGIGMAYNTGEFGLSGDASLESRTYEAARVRVNAGGEVLLADRVALRGGYRFDQGLESHAVSGGLGYVDPKYALDVALRRGVAGPGYFAVVFGFTIHIESMGLGSSSPDAY